VEVVGVFVGTLPEVLRLGQQVPLLRTLQRHAAQHDVASLPAGYRLIEAFQVPGRHSFDYVRQHIATGNRPAAALIDGSAPGQFGGSGHTAPWHDLAGFDPGVPLILAGGLNPDNVAEAIRVVRPYAVDVASGVEMAPGRKDIEKMRRFIDNARSA
jgi:phosphoribosylanthranilate isomerase